MCCGRGEITVDFFSVIQGKKSPSIQASLPQPWVADIVHQWEDLSILGLRATDKLSVQEKHISKPLPGEQDFVSAVVQHRDTRVSVDLPPSDGLPSFLEGVN